MDASEETIADGSFGSEDEQLAFEVGQRLGRYVTLELLGVGGMGQVFSAYDSVLDRMVALKVLRRPCAEDRARLVREAQALARFSHPNVVSVYDVGEVDGQVFIAMELVQGCDLRQWLEVPGRTAAQILVAFRAAARGLQAAHDAGIVHRDFKPDNVLLGADGRVCVTDFGLALRTGEAQPSVEVDAASSSSSSDRLTETGMVMGTPAYMPIEQHLGLPTDVRSDQFSFCVALYEALYGVRPFEGESGAELVLSIERGELREARCADVPRDVHAAIVRGLSPRARDRFGSMLELRDALRPRAPRFGVRWGAGLVAVLVGAATMAVAAGVVERDDVAQAEQGIWLALQGVAVQEAVVVTRARTAADCEAAFGKDLGARMLCLDQAVRVRRVATTG